MSHDRTALPVDEARYNTVHLTPQRPPDRLAERKRGLDGTPDGTAHTEHSLSIDLCTLGTDSISLWSRQIHGQTCDPSERSRTTKHPRTLSNQIRPRQALLAASIDAAMPLAPMLFLSGSSRCASTK